MQSLPEHRRRDRRRSHGVVSRRRVRRRPAMTAEWFRDHVARNDVDLARSPRWTVDGELIGRGAARVSRRAGMGRRLRRRAGVSRARARAALSRRDARARARGGCDDRRARSARAQRAGAIRLYERGGFEQIGELVVWTRAPLRRDGHATAAAAARDVRCRGARGVRAHARRRAGSASCAASPPASAFETLVAGAAAAPDAYAFVAAAPSAASAARRGARASRARSSLLGVLDARVRGQPTALENEPPHGPLHDALAAHGGWRELARQRRMRIEVR